MESDLGRAYKWYSLAAAQGYEGGAKRRNQVYKQLTPVQRNEGQKLAAK